MNKEQEKKLIEVRILKLYKVTFGSLSFEPNYDTRKRPIELISATPREWEGGGIETVSAYDAEEAIKLCREKSTLFLNKDCIWFVLSVEPISNITVK